MFIRNGKVAGSVLHSAVPSAKPKPKVHKAIEPEPVNPEPVKPEPVKQAGVSAAKKFTEGVKNADDNQAG